MVGACWSWWRERITAPETPQPQPPNRTEPPSLWGVGGPTEFHPSRHPAVPAVMWCGCPREQTSCRVLLRIILCGVIQILLWVISYNWHNYQIDWMLTQIHPEIGLTGPNEELKQNDAKWIWWLVVQEKSFRSPMVCYGMLAHSGVQHFTAVW